MYAFVCVKEEREREREREREKERQISDFKFHTCQISHPVRGPDK
jgi:hypothetical protein